MKKSMTAVAACLIAGMVSAQIVSQNIVGYNTVNLYPGYNLLAVNFDGVGEGMSLTLAQLFPTTDEGGALLPGFTAGTVSTGDNIRFYDASTEGYTAYYLYKGAKTSDTKNYKWVSAANGTVASGTPVASGTAFWYKKIAATTNEAIFAGQVANDASESHQILTGYNMFSSIYPAAWNPNDLGVAYWQNSGAMAGTVSTGDNIRLYDATTEGYTAYYLYKGAKTSDTKNYKWVSAANGSVVADKVLTPGVGTWYKHAGTGFTFGQNKTF